MSGFSRVPVALLSATLSLAYADRAVSVATAPVLGDRFGLGDAELGFLNGAALIVPFALASLAFGLGRWRLQTGKVMAGCVVVWTSAAAVFALAPTYEQLVVGRMLMGVGQAALLPAAVAALGPASASGRLSWLTVGSALGRSGGLLTVGALLAIATSSAAAFLPVAAWRASALVMLAPNLVVAVLLWRVGGPRLGGGDEGSRARDALAHMGRRLAAYAPFLTAAAAILIVVQSVGAWTPSLLVRASGLTPAQAASAAGLVVLVGAPVGHLGAGKLSARIAAPVMLAVAAGGAMVNCALIALVAQPAAAMAGLLGLVICGGLGAASALIGLQPLAPTDLRPSVTAIYLGVVTLIAYAVGPLATGLLSDAMDGDASGLGKALLIVVAISGSVCMLTALGGFKAWREVAGSEARS